MRGRLLVVNLLLLAGCAAAGWRLKTAHEERVRRQREFLQERATAAPAPPLSLPAPQPQAPPAMYLPVAQHLLFHKDRNPDVVIEVAAPKPVPPLPRYYGMMNFGDGPRVVLAVPGGPQKSYVPGDEVGDFRLVEVEPDGLVFAWEDRTIRARFDELRDKSGSPPPAEPQRGQLPSVEPAAQQVQPVASVATVNAPEEAKGPGGEPGAPTRPCQPGDSSPAGAVADGYRKVVRRTPFGPTCYWEKVQ